MKLSGHFAPLMRGVIFCILLITLSSRGTAENPNLSAFLVNLSSTVNTEALDDVYPEMVIEGDFIHVLWIEYKYGTENWMYYCRSTDLGKTWETPKQIIKLKSSDYARLPASRELAVDGQNVHIAVCDYDYSANGTGLIHYIRSTNGGSSFQPSKVIASNSGGFFNFGSSHVKAAAGKVAVAYMGAGSKNGLRMLYSTDNGGNFTDTMILDGISYLSDLWFDGNQMIVLSGYASYYYGLNVGRVYASVSANGVNFTSNKVSVTYKESETVDQEICASFYDVHYAPKIAKSGNTIHLVFMGNVTPSDWTVLYTRSTDNGLTFEKARNINNGKLAGNAIQTGQETVCSVNGKVYIAYQSIANAGAKTYFTASSNNGQTFAEAASILPNGFSHIERTWWISLVPDLSDATGSSVYLTGNSMFSMKTTDGGNSFHGSQLAAPFLNNHMASAMTDMVLDRFGQKHWISEMRLRGGTDKDIMYRKIGIQPEPGMKNKALLVETTWNDKAETVVVPSSAHLNFDSAMTAEAWVKFDPSTAHSVSVLAKLNGYDGDDWYMPPGYNMGFRKNQDKFCINNALVTDKGEFINWGDCTIGDTLWHHIAFTYDARADLNNFRTYVDGILLVEKTVTGKIRQGDGMLLIGSRTSFYGNNKYFIDEVRLWNRALSQQELLQNQVAKLTGKEEGLKMYLSFDDTFKDLSGNGHDAIPVYLAPLSDSDHNPPVPGFESFVSGNQVSLNNKTVNGTGYLWSFGDGTTSDKGNPVKVYTQAGEYDVTLTARNAASVASVIRRVTIEGLARIEPVAAGNSGFCGIAVFGGGLKVDGTVMKLRRTGETDLVGKALYSPATGVLSAQFFLENATVGKWDLVVSRGGSDQILKDAFEVVQADKPMPWVSLSGRGATLINMWQSYTIYFGNNGNVAAYGVPVWLAISDVPGLDVEFIDFVVDVPEIAKQKGYEGMLRELGPYFLTDKVQEQPMQARVYPFMIPVIPANSANSIRIRIKTPVNIEIKLWNNPPWLDADPESGEILLKSGSMVYQPSYGRIAGCLTGLAIEVVADIGMAAFTPNLNCVIDAAKFGFEVGMTPPWDKKFSLKSTSWNALVVLVDCGLSLTGIAGFYKATATFLANMWEYNDHLKSCRENGYADNALNTLIYALSSFDPNEMVGPSGYGDKNWIRKNNHIPYTILFENKKEATAPAHIVTIKDTLDLSVFDLSDFGFGSFGWGDTLFTPPGNNLTEFSMDIDLRPGLALITRVSAKLDTLTGIAQWEFLSLNPQTMELEEDPMLGFLPPNATSPEGEGFVSFRVGLKRDLKTGDELRNRASIVFDANEPIITNEYLNTLDEDTPESRVLTLEATTKDYFTVQWSGSDNGSGIRAYHIFVLENDTLLRPWLVHTKEHSGVFVGQVGSTYKFYSIAVDNVSLTEGSPDGYDAFTTVTVDLEEFELKRADLKIYPNPARERVTVQFPNAPCGAYVLEMRSVTGQVIVSELHDDYTLSNGLNLDVRGLKPGQYFLRVIYGNKSENRMILIN